MILIGGAEVDIDSLPFCEVMEYTVEPNVSILNIKLKTVAKRDNCLGVYLHSDLSDLWVSDDIKEKTFYFSSEEELHNLLETYGVAEEEPDEEVEEEEQVLEFGAPTNNTSSTEVDIEIPEDIDTDLTEVLLEIPHIDTDADSLQQQLLNKEKIINQQVAIIEELKSGKDDLLDIQEEQLLEMKQSFEIELEKEIKALKDEYEAKLTESNSAELEKIKLEYETKMSELKEDLEKEYKDKLEEADRIIAQKETIINELKGNLNSLTVVGDKKMEELKSDYELKLQEANKKIEEMSEEVDKSGVPTELVWFLKYATYSKNNKAVLREGFTDDELGYLGRPTSDIFIFASGAGDSLHSMMKNVKSLMDTSKGLLIVDFSNDYFMNTRYRIQSKESSINLNDESITAGELAKPVGGVELIPTSFYNDIALLSMDWVKILKKLMTYASGRPIIILFNNINSFSVKYTVSKLSTYGQLWVFAKCNPIILSTLFGDLAFIPDNRFKVAATDYIDVVQGILESLSKKHQVTAFKENVNWSKLGLKV